MTDNIVDLNKARNDRERPDPEFIKHDDFGRELFMFTLDYEYQNANWDVSLWAYSAEDAEARVVAMRENLKNVGQVFCVVPYDGVPFQ